MQAIYYPISSPAPAEHMVSHIHAPGNCNSSSGGRRDALCEAYEDLRRSGFARASDILTTELAPQAAAADRDEGSRSCRKCVKRESGFMLNRR